MSSDDEITIWGYSLEDTISTIKNHVLEKSDTPYKYWQAFVIAVNELERSDEWMVKLMEADIARKELTNE